MISVGRTLSIAERIFSRLDSLRMRMSPPAAAAGTAASLSARILICCADSSPRRTAPFGRRSRDFERSAAGGWICRSPVRPRAEPPIPERSPLPGRGRTRDWWFDPRRGVGGDVFESDGLGETAAPGPGRTAGTLFQEGIPASAIGQRPSHLVEEYPQCWHSNTEPVLDISILSRREAARRFSPR